MRTKKSKIYIQYGSGAKSVPGGLSFDSSPTLRIPRFPLIGRLLRNKLNCVFDDEIIYGDIVKGLPIGEASVDVVFCSHILEHLALEEFYKALKNTFRILKPGGKIRIFVPSLQQDIKDYMAEYASDYFGGQASIRLLKRLA